MRVFDDLSAAELAILPLDPLGAARIHEGAGVDDEFAAMLPAAALVEVTHHEDLGIWKIALKKCGSVATLMQPAFEHEKGAGWRKRGVPCAMDEVPAGRVLDRAEFASDQAGEFVALRWIVRCIGKLTPHLEDFFTVGENLAFPW